MSNLATIENSSGSSLAQWNREQLELIKTQIAKDCSDAELQLFGQVCQRTGLDPFARQIYAIKRGKRGSEKMSIQTSIDGFRLIADRTGQYAGSDTAVFDEGLSLFEHKKSGRSYPTVATVTVYKMVKGTRCPFTAEASWDEYKQEFYDKDSRKYELGKMWAGMPHHMLAKCAESLALRKAFPAELSGLYTREEMMQADSDAIATSAVEVHPANDTRPITDAQLKRLKTISSKHGWMDDIEAAKALMKEFGFESSKDVTRDCYEPICNWLERGPEAFRKAHNLSPTLDIPGLDVDEAEAHKQYMAYVEADQKQMMRDILDDTTD